jgi:hypothetical protein
LEPTKKPQNASSSSRLRQALAQETSRARLSNERGAASSAGQVGAVLVALACFVAMLANAI